MSEARRTRANILVVTDHETVRGSEEVAQISNGNPKFVIKAAEYKTEKGDLIGLLLKQEVVSRKSDEVIEEIHAQGGLVVLPHPYKGHRLDETLLRGVDLVETHNARCSPSQNQAALDLATQLSKPQIAGSDAHCAGEITAALNEFDADSEIDENHLAELLLSAPRRATTQPTSRIYQPYSQIIKSFKTRNPVLFAYQLKRLAMACSEQLWSS